MPRRRNLLISIGGALALSGCTGQSEQAQETTNDSSPGENTRNTTQSEETQTAENESNIQNESESGEQPEESEDVSASDIEEIDSAKSSLNEALVIYTQSANSENATILEVTSLSDEYDFLPVVNTARNADEKLDEAERFVNDDEILAEIELVRDEYRLIDAIARAQDLGQQARIKTENYHSLLDENNGTTRIRNEIEDILSEFEGQIGKIESDLEDISSTSVREVTLYESKVTQFNDEVENFNIYVSIGPDYRAAVETLDRANSEYNSENYGSAESLAENAEEQFNAVIDTLSETNGSVLDALTEEFESTIQSKIISAQSLQDRASNPPE